jgi:CheY-like chemotaxis protein
VRQSILLASRDDASLRLRSSILRVAGYRTACTGSLVEAISLSRDLSPNLIILGHSFSAGEQSAFVEELHETQPGTCVLCLQFGLVDPMMLLAECKSILSAQPSCTRARSLRAH